MCQSHAHQYFDQSAVEDLKEFVLRHGGHVNMCHATLRVELKSQMEADQFLVVLITVQKVFDISLKLGWKATRSYIKDLCLGIAKEER